MYPDLPIGAGAIRVSFYSREDLDVRKATGFTIYLDLSGLELGPHRSVTIGFALNGSLKGELTMAVTDEAATFATAYGPVKEAKKKHLASLFTADVKMDGRCFAPSALPDNWPVSPRLEDKKDAVSSHFYGTTIYDFLNEFPEGSIFLDAGAGLRKRPLSNVINLEIYDYPSTDILSIGQALPFKDNSFDGILSLAVLEHVDDPFQCAKELARVLKPGGKILAMIPFLQAEHGYPSHYFNATRAGVVKLFESLDLVSQTLDQSNHPIFTLQQVAGIYLSGLPREHRDSFLSLPIKSLFEVAQLKSNGMSHPMLDIDIQSAFKIAWGTTSVFVKNS
jgi:hypothetical protein